MTGTSPAQLSVRELAAWRGMLATHASLIAHLDAELERRHGIPLSSYEVLMYLADAEDERLRMGELVDRLERQGMIERERCEDDGRGYFAVLTPAGRRKLDAARPDHRAGVRRHFLSQLEPGELDALAAVWARLAGQASAPDLDEAAR